MSRKRVFQGAAAASVVAFLGGFTILAAGAPDASADRTTAAPSASTSVAAAGPSTTVSSADATTTATAAATTTTAAPSSTTTAPAPTTTAPPATTTTTARRGPAAPKASGPGTVQLLELPSGDADGRTREVWVYRPAVPDSATLPVVYFLHGYPGS